MPTATYATRRGELLQYFDRTAVDAWKRLTSDAPVNSIRATVRAGRDDMRNTLLSWLPDDLRGRRILDAGCGTGAFSVEAAKRGAHVVAIDLSPTLVDLARERLPHDLGDGHIDFHVGDMLDPTLGHFDHVVAMDSLIHYRARYGSRAGGTGGANGPLHHLHLRAAHDDADHDARRRQIVPAGQSFARD
ncbi:MAG: magnesium protoporphyrin IX methyltransferase [Rhodopila sp.]